MSGSGMGMKAQQDVHVAKGLRTNYFYLVDKINVFCRYVSVGFPIILPLVVGFFFPKIGLGIVAVEILSFVFGKLAQDFDYWYNTEYHSMGLKLDWTGKNFKVIYNICRMYSQEIFFIY